jgi:hypothetical protein
MAAVLAVRPGSRTRMFYRMHVYRGRKNETKGLRESDYMQLLCAPSCGRPSS